MSLFRRLVSRDAAAGATARGVVTGVRHDMSDGDRPVRTRVAVRVRPRSVGGELGEEAALSAWVGWKTATLLEPGLDIPIEVDATGRAVGIEAGQLADELRDRSGAARKRRRGWSLETPLDGITQLPGMVGDLLRPAPGPDAVPGLPLDDPRLAPAAAGVTWQQYVAVNAELARGSSDPVDELAARHGVPDGTWAAAAREFMQRQMESPDVAVQFGRDVEIARRALG